LGRNDLDHIDFYFACKMKERKLGISEHRWKNIINVAVKEVICV